MRAITQIARYLRKPYPGLANPCHGNPVHNFHHYANALELKVDPVSNSKHGPKFWIGNALLTLAFACLFFMASVSAYLGAWAMVLWMALAAAGFYLLTSDRGGSDNLPD